jgi:hypothetical protein
MRPRTTLALVVVACLALLGGWYFGLRGSQPATVAPSGQLAFPDLAGRLAQAARIEIQHAGHTTVLQRRGALWMDDAAGGYPVQPGKLHAVLAGLTELRLMEPRTDDPALMDRLGLDDTGKPASTAILLRVLDESGKPIAALVLGRQRPAAAGGLAPQLYVRRPDQTQAWLAEGRLEVSDDPSSWLDREIANIPTEQIRSADVQQGDQHLVFGRDAEKVVLTAPADHPPLDQYKLDDVFRAYEYLTFNAVKPVAQMPGTAAGGSVFTTTTGMRVHAEVFRDGQDVWARFSAEGSGAAEKPAQALEARVRGWAYQIVAWKQNALAPTLDALKSPPPAKPPTP